MYSTKLFRAGAIVGACGLATVTALAVPGLASAESGSAASISSLSGGGSSELLGPLGKLISEGLGGDGKVDAGSLDAIIGSVNCYGPAVPPNGTHIDGIGDFIASLGALSGIIKNCD